MAIACVLALLAASCGASQEATCAETVIVDWNNGNLGNEFEPDCYRDALGALPEDVRLYSSAPEEIKRALRASLVARAPREQSTEKPGDEQAAPSGGDARQLSGRQPQRTSAAAETTAVPAPGAPAGPTPLPWPVALTLTLILVICAGGVASAVARRVRAHRVAGRGASGPP